MKPFEHWTAEEVEKTFGLTETYHYPLLLDWIKVEGTIEENEEKAIKQLREELIFNIQSWNEEEVKMLFIGPFLNFVHYYHKNYKPFLERKLSLEIDGVQAAGRVDFLLAHGKRSPEQPYFCLHEYKREEPKGKGDTLGQLLIAMLAAQQLNENTHPVYGAYVMGRLWFLVVLKDKQYAVSLAYDTTKDDVFDLFLVLKKLKKILEKMLSK